MTLPLSISTGEINNTNAELTFVDILRHNAKQFANQPAIVHLDTVLTYAQLDAMSDAVAAELLQHGVQKGDRVGICVSRTEVLPVCLFGALKAGAAYVPLDPNYPPKRLAFMVENAGIKTVLSEQQFFDKFTKDTGNVLDVRQFMFSGHGVTPLNITPDDFAAVIYTSGSTGIPKGVQLCHRNIVSVVTHYTQLHCLTPEDAVSTYASFSFVAHFFEYYPPILAGASLHIIDDSIRLDLRAVNRYFEDNKIAVSFLPTAFGHRFITQLKNNSLRSVVLAGERFIPIEKTENTFKIFNAYGTTECASYISITQIYPQQQPITVGTANDNMEIYIVNSNNELVSVGETGELCVSGRQISNGYLGLPEKTASAFVKNPFNTSPDYATMYHTGDVARMDENGQIEIRGRLDHQVKVRGFRVELGEIDTVALQYPDISEAVTVAVVGPDGENRLVIYVASPETIDAKSLQKHIGDELPPYMIPAQVVQLPKLPRNLNGKIDRSALPTVELSSNVDAADLPQTATEKQIAVSVAAILKVSPDGIGRSTNLFDIGLDSLLTMDLVLEIHRQCNVDLSVGHIKENPTVALLSAIVDKLNINKRNEQETVLPVAVKEFYPTTKMQQLFLNSAVSDPQDINNNVSLALTFSANTDIEKLKDAITKTITAHSGMSATFIRNGKKFLLKRNEPNIHIETSELTDEEYEKHKLAFPKPFNVFQDDRLYHIEICKTPSAIKLLLDIHHSIYDGTSHMIFINDVVNAYGGASIPLETFTIFDEAEDEAKRFTAEKTLNYTSAIKKRIKQFGNATQIPGAKINLFTILWSRLFPKISKSVPVTATLTQQSSAIRNLCKKAGIGGANVIFTVAFALVISSLASKKNILFGHTVSGRTTASRQRSIGAFARGVPLFVELPNNNYMVNSDDTIKLLRNVDKEIADSTVYCDVDTKLFGWTLPLIYLFHGSLLDPAKMPVIEGQRVIFEFIPKSYQSKNTTPALVYIVNDDEGVFKITLFRNRNYLSQKLLNEILAKITDNIEKLITNTVTTK
ncbi:MAG: amino acid adenylation domain-containing protein [Planctomycetaceae bacterium]|jgi:amino acid adenylation domain-containing protein|nr:amino acid adenylation domain-containing protein [Planctomycetaceae bacterium]